MCARGQPPRAMAVAAHPDDIEFLMAGTLVLLKRAGFDIHYLTVANGSCGSMEHPPARTARIRAAEARRAAGILGARFHPSLCRDLEIRYEAGLLRRLAAVIRAVNPRILLVPSPQDYMEDHTMTSRLAVTAAFARGMPNFRTIPQVKPVAAPVVIYHAMPHGLRDQLGGAILPSYFVDTSSVITLKTEALAAHHSQKAWLDRTQGMNSYLQAMNTMSLQVGEMSGRFRHAEGWRRHLHLGFSREDDDPLPEILGPRCLSKPRRTSSTSH